MLIIRLIRLVRLIPLLNNTVRNSRQRQKFIWPANFTGLLMSDIVNYQKFKISLHIIYEMQNERKISSGLEFNSNTIVVVKTNLNKSICHKNCCDWTKWMNSIFYNICNHAPLYNFSLISLYYVEIALF